MAMRLADIQRLVTAKKLEGLHGAGASEDEIADCEALLGIVLPASYREFLQIYGWGYFGSLELIAGLGSDIPSEWAAGACLTNVVIHERSGPLRMPKDLIPFAQNGAGDWYAVESAVQRGGEAPVYFVSHEAAASNADSRVRSAESFAQWLFERLSSR